MRKKLLATAMMSFVMMSAQAQVYGYDDYVRMPTMDLYDNGVMGMALNAYRETAEMRDRAFKYYSQRTIEAYYDKRWYDVIENANQTIKIAPIGGAFFMRGAAFEALGYYKEALRDYKAGKKDGYADAAYALEALKARMKEMKKKK